MGCYDHSTIVLNERAGQGRNDLTINVGGQVVAIEPYAYAAPVVTAVSPDEAATEGDVPMIITGSHLGIGSDYVVSFEIDGEALFSTADGGPEDHGPWHGLPDGRDRAAVAHGRSVRPNARWRRSYTYV